MANRGNQTTKDSVATVCGNDCANDSNYQCACEGEHIFVLQRRTDDYTAVSSLIQQVWDGLSNKEWFAVDDPDYLTYIFTLASTLVFHACTPGGQLAAVCVLVTPESEEENLAGYAGIPRSEWHQVMYVDIAATLPVYRGHSLQSRLMNHAECFLRENRDTKYLMATVHPHNLPSRRSMEKLGYACVAQTTMYGGLPRCVYMKRI